MSVPVWRPLLRLLAPPVSEHATPAGALAQVALASPRQHLAGLLLTGAAAALASYQRAWDWLGLFALMLAPVLLAQLAAWLARSRPRLGWGAIWTLLLAALAAASLAAVPIYRWWSGTFNVGVLSAPQLAASVAGFGLLTMAVPLWHLHSKSAALRLASAERAALAAELKALQAQIEPHFLFNTLANTRHLVRQDDERALPMLDHLIGYLRNALPDLRRQGSTLGRECELAEHYLSIMTMRFGDRMSYRIDCPDELKGAAVPPLMLMSLVENAVQHGVEGALGEVCVQLCASAQDGCLRLLVRDNGCGGVAGGGGGVGLSNLSARLAALYGTAASFELRVGAGRPTEAELRLPLEQAA